MRVLRKAAYKFVTRLSPLRAAYFGRLADRAVASAFARQGASPIIIYQMGKVGSTTVYSTVKATEFTDVVLHVHTLTDNIQAQIDTVEKLGVIPAPFHFYLGRALRRRLLGSADAKVKLISLVRDPIAREVSGFFQTPYYHAEHGLTDADGTVSAPRVHEYLRKTFARPETFRYCDEWFDREVMSFFGIDVFSRTFPHDDGYCVLKEGNVELLVLQMERLTDLGPKVLSDFLGTGSLLELLNDNERSSSPGSSEYKKLLKDFFLEESVCRSIYSSRFTRHFYSSAAIEGFISRWSRPPAAGLRMQP